MLFGEPSCMLSPLIICRATSARNSFDFKRYSPNLPPDALLCPCCSALPVTGCCRSCTFTASHLICLRVFVGLPYKGKRKSLILTRTESLGSHKGSSGFCKSLYFPLQTPLPAGNQLFYKRRKKGCSEQMTPIIGGWN